MTVVQSLQIILTLIVTGMWTFLFDLVTKDRILSKKWLLRTGQFLLVFHAIALPIALINLIWSIQ